ncbi:MAG: hypothetical protein OEM83_08365, partial [Gammaproteobacteria bacterium]|nr:hypothetical protein [Gammaproteobacteria bacterium]
MLRSALPLIVSTVLLGLGAGCTREVSFKQDVFPVLRDNCMSCHVAGGAGQVKSGLNLESYEGLMKGTKLGPIVV